MEYMIKMVKKMENGLRWIQISMRITKLYVLENIKIIRKLENGLWWREITPR